jgi:hypothetical protein
MKASQLKECRMDQETEREVEEVEVVEVDERSADSLLWISSAANVLSWIVLVVFIVWAGIQVYVQITIGGWQPALDIQAAYISLSILWQLLLGIGLFVLLQAVAKSSLVLLDLLDRDL